MRNLPQHELEEFLEYVRANEPSMERLLDLDLDALPPILKTKLEAIEARLARQQRRSDLMKEAADIAKPISRQYPELPFRKIDWFLPEPDRSRFQAILRELDELA